MMLSVADFPYLVIELSSMMPSLSDQARWQSQGNLQSIVIEKQNGGTVYSGDTVYLKTYSGNHIDVTDKAVQARWHDLGSWQALVIEKRVGDGAVLPGGFGML